MKKILTFSALSVAFFAVNIMNAVAQCGVDGTQPCKTTPAKSAAKKPKPPAAKPAPKTVAAAKKTVTSKSSKPVQMPPTATKPVDKTAIENKFWASIENSTDVDDFKLYKEKYPNGDYTNLADLKIRQLSRPSVVKNNPPLSVINNPPSNVANNQPPSTAKTERVLYLIESYKAPAYPKSKYVEMETYDYRIKYKAQVNSSFTNALIYDVWQRITSDMQMKPDTQDISPETVKKALSIYLENDWHNIGGQRPWTHWNFLRGLSESQFDALVQEVTSYMRKNGVQTLN